MSRDAGQVHPPRAMLGEEQHMQAAQQHVSTWKKSAARIVLAWASRKVRQAWTDRVDTGSMPASLRICQTGDGAILYPRPVSSPWMRR
jgi:hypothetical protein